MSLILHNALLNNKAVDITIDNGLIVNVVSSDTRPRQPQAAATPSNLEGEPERSVSETIDAHGLSVFPGLCNMHSHAPMTLFRGLGDDQPLDVWLNDYIWPAEQRLTDELVYEGTLQACREMLASGTTFFNDMYFRLPAMAQAVRDSGIKARLGYNVFGDADCLTPNPSPKGEGSEKQGYLFPSPLGEGQGVRLSLAPHSIYTVTEKGLRRCADACADLHLPMHIHMSETQKEVDDCLREHGCRPWEWLDKLGILDLLGSHIIAAHCLHLSDDEIRLIGNHGITCVHCPNSNLKLGSGYRFPMLELLAAGAKVALGTDGSASSNNLDMIEVMKTAALLQKGWRGDPTVVPVEQILSLATLGHTIATGQPADLFLIKVTESLSDKVTESLSHSATQSLSNLIYATHGDSVMMTIVDGKIVYRKQTAEQQFRQP